MTIGIDTSKELSRSDAIRFWQDAKAAAAKAADERDKALQDVKQAFVEIGNLKRTVIVEQEARKAAEGQISAAEGRTNDAKATIEKLERQLKQTRDYKGVNARLLTQRTGLEEENKLLKQKVASLQAHDFQADLGKARMDLKVEKQARIVDGQRFEEREANLRIENTEKSAEIETLTKRVKELGEQVERLQPKKEASV